MPKDISVKSKHDLCGEHDQPDLGRKFEIRFECLEKLLRNIPFFIFDHFQSDIE